MSFLQAQDVVDEIIAAKEGRGKFSSRQAAPVPAPHRDNYRERDMAAERSGKKVLSFLNKR